MSRVTLSLGQEYINGQLKRKSWTST